MQYSCGCAVPVRHIRNTRKGVPPLIRGPSLEIKKDERVNSLFLGRLIQGRVCTVCLITAASRKRQAKNLCNLQQKHDFMSVDALKTTKRDNET